jgi:MFS family permease
LALYFTSMNITGALRRRRIYQGWWVISVPFLSTAMAVGAGQYGFGLFIEPLEESFGWNRSQISASLSFTALGSLIAPFIGRIMDRHGSKYVLACSLALIAVSYFLRPFMTELWHWYALSLVQYLGAAAGFLPAGRLVGMWFLHNRGRVMGITAMGANFGGLVMPPFLALLLPILMWQGSYIVLALISVALIVYTLAVIDERPPTPNSDDCAGETQNEERPGLTGWTLKEALHCKGFYAITLATMLGSFTYAAILPQIIAHLTDQGVSVRTASLVLSVYAVMGMTGKFVMGFLAERITARYALMIDLCGQAIFLIVMLWAGTPAIMWMSVPVYGFFSGAYGALFPLVIQDAFGIRHYGSIMGTLSMAHIVSFGIGPLLAGASFDLTDSYSTAFVIVAVLFVIGAASLTQAKVTGPPPTSDDVST